MEEKVEYLKSARDTAATLEARAEAVKPSLEQLERDRDDLLALVEAQRVALERRRADYDAEIDEFNAGFEAFGNGKSLDDMPDIRFDVWHHGWKSAAYDALSATRDDPLARLWAGVDAAVWEIETLIDAYAQSETIPIRKAVKYGLTLALDALRKRTGRGGE
jgi:hypothetical protein